MDIKLKVGRAQLGTALSLFVRDRDPISVHALACGGSEIIEGLAQHSGIPTLSSQILEEHPEFDFRKIKALRNQYWNGIKHFYKQGGDTIRDDTELLSDFSDAANDTVLFMGWLDYMLIAKKLPIEVQVFQVWWYATNEEKLSPNVDLEAHRALFPDIKDALRMEQKRRLRRSVEKYRKNKSLLSDPRTEFDPLISDVEAW